MLGQTLPHPIATCTVSLAQCEKLRRAWQILADEAADQAAALDASEFECSGIAFVTFQKQSVAKKLLKQGITRRISFSKLLEEDPTLAEKHPELENGVCFKIVKAPEPSDIIWENLQGVSFANASTPYWQSYELAWINAGTQMTNVRPHRR